MAPMKRRNAKLDPWLSESVSLVELSRRWHMTRAEVRHLLGRGELRFVEVYGSLRVPRKAVESYEQAHRR
jgi:hypothetical protein